MSETERALKHSANTHVDTGEHLPPVSCPSALLTCNHALFLILLICPVI